MLNEIYEEVGRDFNIDPKTVKKIHKAKTRWLKQQLREVNYIHIIDTGLGNYTMLKNAINNKLYFINKERDRYKEEEFLELERRYKSYIERQKNLKLRTKKTKRQLQCTN